MTAELTQEISSRLTADEYGWLTTVAKSGQPVPRLIWFFFDGSDLVVYSAPERGQGRSHQAASAGEPQPGLRRQRRRHRRDRRSGADAGVDRRDDAPYWAKYGAIPDQFGLTDTMANYSTRIKISIDKVWGTPTEG